MLCKVTQELIDSTTDPVLKAINAELKGGWVATISTIDNVDIYKESDVGMEHPTTFGLPRSAFRALDRLANGKTIKPFNFQLPNIG